MIPISFEVPCPGQKAISPNLATAICAKISEQSMPPGQHVKVDERVVYQLTCTTPNHGWQVSHCSWDMVTTGHSYDGTPINTTEHFETAVPTGTSFGASNVIWTQHIVSEWDGTMETTGRIENLKIFFTRAWNDKILRNSQGVILRGANGAILRNA